MNSISSFIDVEIEGYAFRMFADRGLYWPAHRMLFVADTHLGKDATFRRYGLAVPAGSTDATLHAIDRMIDASDASRVVILGDMFHAKSSLSPSVCQSLETFFARHPDIRFTLIRGNHDKHVGSLPRAWPLEILEPGEVIERVILAHEPGHVPVCASLLLCGHIHPAVRVGSRSERLGKVACFWLSNRCLVLPAIGKFTGTYAISPKTDDQVWLILDDQVMGYQEH